MNKELVTVDGDYPGSDLAKAPDAEMGVTPIARAGHFTHAPAMINPTLLDQALLPYSGLLQRGKVVQDDVVSDAAATIFGNARQRSWLDKALKSLAAGRRIGDLNPYAP